MTRWPWRIAAWPMACARCDLPVPGGPRNSASSWRAMKWPVASSKTRRRLIFLLKSKSKLSSVRCGSRNWACLLRRSIRRVLLRASSSDTRAPSKSIGAICSVCACRMRVSTTSAMPPRRSWVSDLVSSTRFISIFLLTDAIDQIAVLGELSDQRVDLAQADRRAGAPFQVAAHEAVGRQAQLQRRATRIVDAERAVLAPEREHALDAPLAHFRLALVDQRAQPADIRACAFGAEQELIHPRRRVARTVFGRDAMTAASLGEVLAQEQAGLRVEHAHALAVPLHGDGESDEAGRRGVVGAVNLDAAVEPHRARAVLVVAKGLRRQRQECRLLLRKHLRHLALGRAVDARVGPALLPSIEMRLRVVQTLEAQPLERRFLRVPDARFDLALAIGIAHAARQRDGAVVREHISVERIDRSVVDVRQEHALFQVVEHDHEQSAAQPPESGFVQLRPHPCARAED